MPTTMTAGDIAFTALQSDNSGGGANGDFFQFVLLKDVTTGTIIYFTDNGYRTDTSTFRTNETMMRWVAQSDLPAGTLISFTAPGGTAVASTAEWTGINPLTGAALATATLTLAAGGENITAIVSPTFGGAEALNGTAIAAITQNPTFAATFTNASGNASSALPPGLTDGVNAVSITTFDNSRYNGTTTGSANDLRTAINTDSNWTGSNTPLTPHNVASFTVTGGPAQPTLSVDNVTLAEGDAGMVTFTFTVSLSAPAGPGGVTFDIATADGTATDDNPATEDNDYVGIALTGQTIPAGSSTYTFDVTVNGDNAPEPNETFFVNVTNVTGATVGDGQGQGTINNDDTPGTLAINDVTLAEGNSGTTAFTFTVTRSSGSEGAVGATWTLNLPGGANADSGDFDAGQSLTGSVSFADGETSQTITVLVQGDIAVEPDEGFTVTLSSPTGGATITDDTGAGTITNDDSPPVASIADAALVEGDDGVTYLVFTVTLDHASDGIVTYDYATANGSAAAGSDYVARTGQVSFAVGETVQTISVPIIGDEAPESNETLTVTLTNPVGGTIGDGVATGTITNDDGAGYFPLATGNFGQDWTDTSQISANDNWSGVPFIIGYLGDVDSGQPTGVDPRTLTGPALGAVDVIPNLIATTNTSGGVGEFEIADPTVGLQGSGTADAPSLVLYMDASGRTNIRVQANLRDIDTTGDDAVQQVNVQYRTSPTGSWTNVPGAYFPDVTTGGSATQETPLDVILPAAADNAATLEIRILTTNAGGSDEWVGIDDIVVSSLLAPPSYSIANAAGFEGNSGTSPITFTVTRAGDTTSGGSVSYTISFPGGGFSASTSDLVIGHPLIGTVIFAAGETSQIINVQVQGDTNPEADEGFTVTLSNPSAGTVVDGTATGTIVNDDGDPPFVSIGDVVLAEGNAGTTSFTFTVTRTGGTGAFTVDYQTADGSAAAGSDYVAESGTLSFAAGEMSQTVTIDVNGDLAFELAETFQVNLSNPTGFAVIVDGAGTGTIQNDDVLFISQIQGTSYYSPILAGEGLSSFNTASTTIVVVQAVVTAVDNDGPRQGYYLSEQIGDWDANPLTSEGIFVMTRNDAGVGSPVSGVAVGDLVTVTAQVMEYQAFDSMPRTMLVNPGVPIVNSGGNSLPTLVLGSGIPNSILTGVTPDYTDSSDGAGDSFDASLYALSFFETVEGMLVTIPDLVVADGFVNTVGGQPIFQAYSTAIADADQVNSRGGYTVAGDPPLSPPDTPETDDGTTQGGRHLHDGDTNPDIIEVDFSGFAIDAPAGLTQQLSMGDTIGDVTGIIDFDFTDRKLFVTSYDSSQFVDTVTTRETTALGADDRSLTVATFNVENLDPGDGAARFAALADAIANNLNMPDIISIEEMQDNNGAAAGDGIDDDPSTPGIQDATGADASVSWQMLVDALNVLTGANYQWVDQEPVYNEEGGQLSGNIRVGFLYNTDRVQLGDLAANATLSERRQYTDRIGDGVRDAGDQIDFSDDMIAGEINGADWTNTRLSLLGQFTFHGNAVFVTANHFTAKGGSGDFWQIDQDLAAGEPENSGWARRNAQAQDVYTMLNHVQANAAGAGIVAGGDFNDFYFYRPLETLTGYTLADGTARVGGARFDNLTLTLPEAERYTFNFDGRSHAIDHVVANALLSGVAVYDIVHLNTGFNPLGTGANADASLSDHDPGLASFDFRDFAETLTGTPGNDTINGAGGNDDIQGGDGDDTLYGGTGDDNLDGGEGDDVLVGQGGNDTLAGGPDDDTYIVDNAGDVVSESPGEGEDIVYATVSYMLAFGAEVETLAAASQQDTSPIDLTGNALDNVLWGNAGVNILNSGGGSDMLFGLGGNDVYLVGGSDDLVFEFVGGGWDTIFSTGNYTLQPGSEIEVLSTSRQQDSVPTELKGNEFGNQLWGNAGDNMLDGAGGDDALFGLGGDDTLIGDGGTDELWGGTGDDVYIVDDAGDEANDLAGEGTDIVYTSVSYVLGAEREIETLSTSSQQGTGAIDLTGNEFANTLWGNAGANVLDGGGGVDLLLGLGGADTFAFTTALGAGNVDFIGDMVSGLDEIALDDAVFTGLSTGALDPNAFRLGAAAQDADDRILYDATTGALYFDADGNGAGAAVQFASVQPATVIAAGDFTVI